MSLFGKAKHNTPLEQLKVLLLGRRVVDAQMSNGYADEYTPGPVGYLILDNGMVLKVWGNDGGCACSSGCYPLQRLSAVENVILGVDLIEDPHDDYDGGEGAYRIFVFTANEMIELASFEGSDGNGYYGTGWWLSISAPKLGEET